MSKSRLLFCNKRPRATHLWIHSNFDEETPASENEMCTEELECGVCYQTYNAGRRCPRELQCKHSFCESCLLALSRPLGPGEAHLEAGRLIVCPLCRLITSISDQGKIRAELRVDECALERLTTAGLLDQKEDDDPELDDQVQNNEEEEATATGTPAEESESSAASRGGRLRRSWKKVWGVISGKGQQRRENCMTSAELRALALMSCHMF